MFAYFSGLNLVQSKLSVGAIVKSNLTFCIMSPLGIGIGKQINLTFIGFLGSWTPGFLPGWVCPGMYGKSSEPILMKIFRLFTVMV